MMCYGLGFLLLDMDLFNFGIILILLEEMILDLSEIFKN